VEKIDMDWVAQLDAKPELAERIDALLRLVTFVTDWFMNMWMIIKNSQNLLIER